MTNCQFTLKENFRSQMKLINLHKQLNDGLSNFFAYLNQEKDFTALQELNQIEYQDNIIERISDINHYIHEMTSNAKLEKTHADNYVN